MADPMKCIVKIANKAGEKITQLDIATAAGVTEVTIRNRVKELKKMVGSTIHWN
jgi:transcription initiation factor TFIIIB Brf1 subunit/transcription initiation factor TFIIB